MERSSGPARRRIWSERMRRYANSGQSGRLLGCEKQAQYLQLME